MFGMFSVCAFALYNWGCIMYGGGERKRAHFERKYYQMRTIARTIILAICFTFGFLLHVFTLVRKINSPVEEGGVGVEGGGGLNCIERCYRANLNIRTSLVMSGFRVSWGWGGGGGGGGGRGVLGYVAYE